MTRHDVPSEAFASTFKVMVSPSAGRLRFLPPKRFSRGVELVEAGQPVARLESGRGDTLLLAPISGRVSAVLGLEGEPVVAGHALLAIEPELV